MPSTDPRVDAYIARAAPFAQPLLAQLRAGIHGACHGLEESIKWGMPAFLYRGRILAGIAAFKQHAALNVWRRDGGAGDAPSGDMGQYGRLCTVADLPSPADLVALLQAGMARIDAMQAGQPAARTRVAKPPLPEPPALTAALEGAPGLRATFDAMAPGCRREYIEWISEAKREATRDKRIATLVAQVAEGKALHWKYQRAAVHAGTTQRGARSTRSTG